MGTGNVPKAINIAYGNYSAAGGVLSPGIYDGHGSN